MNTYRVPEQVRDDLAQFLHQHYHRSEFTLGKNDGGTFVITGSKVLCNLVHAFVKGWTAREERIEV